MFWTLLAILGVVCMAAFLTNEAMNCIRREREEKAAKEYVATLVAAITTTRMYGEPMWCRFPNELTRRITEAAEAIKKIGSANDLPDEALEVQRIVAHVAGKYLDMVQKAHADLQGYDVEALDVAMNEDGIVDVNVLKRRAPLAARVRCATDKCADLFNAARQLGFNPH